MTHSVRGATRTPDPCAASDPRELQDALAAALADAGLRQSLGESHPHLFSACHIDVPTDDLARMQAVVTAVEQVVATPGYRTLALSAASVTAQHDPRTPGACFGYDFHLTPAGPRLIEINTNAGGALLALALTRAHLARCPERNTGLPGNSDPRAIENQIAAMFVGEWRAARGDLPLRTIAIVDDAPAQQFLYPEFILFRELFRRHGIEAVIADATGLAVRDGRLRAGDLAIDLVYNRVTDFLLAEPAHAALRSAYLEDLAVVTPHPRAHALYADKRNLAVFTNPEQLRTFSVPEPAIEILQAGVAHTRRVDRAEAERLWSERKKLFFKPVAGYGSKAVYRGDKLTRRVWEEILAADYVAQALAPPAETIRDQTEAALKYDVRNFAYAGQVQLLAARLYQGQTTNFRTPGGGFAPVFRAADVV
jgi:hypothetical protein